MRKNLVLLSCVAMTCISTASVGAVEVIDGACVSVADPRGCLFSGNIAPNTVTETQTKYNLYNNTHPAANLDIALSLLFKSDDGAGFPGLVSGSTSGTWSTPGFIVDYLAVKASNAFVLYKLATPASNGLWSTINIPFRRNPHALSHLAFFGRAGDRSPPGVPEPATWAMMIIGFGLIGLSKRLRRNNPVVSA